MLAKICNFMKLLIPTFHYLLAVRLKKTQQMIQDSFRNLWSVICKQTFPSLC